jgi:hypothetical protein
MRTRAVIVGMLSAAIGLSSTCAAQASSRSAGSLASERVSTWQLSPAQTSSKHWQYVGVSGFDIRSRGHYSVRVRTHLSGGRVLLRVVDNGKVISPQSRALRPTGRLHTFFFNGSGPRRACGHLLRIEWRSAKGATVSLKAGTLTVDYNRAPHDSGACA